jgi:hypothetical protein
MTSQTTAAASVPRSTPRLSDDPGIRFGIAVACLVGAVLIDDVTRLGRIDAALSLILIGGLTAAGVRARRAAIVGLVGWAFYTGFVENSFGTLSLAGADLARMTGFVAATAVIAYGVREALAVGGRRHG